jgi:hypothetical protein
MMQAICSNALFTNVTRTYFAFEMHNPIYIFFKYIFYLSILDYKSKKM